MFLLALTSLFAVLNVGNLVQASSGSLALGGPVVLEVVDVVGLGLFLWGLTAAIRGRPWASRRD